MKYLCLIYGDEKQWARMPAAEMDSCIAHFAEFTTDVKTSANYVGSNRLQETAAARTVRVRDGRVSITDGPFAETKEQLGGYYLIEAGGMDEALAIAARIPGARWGCVEVRPVAEFP
ncbi:YciI family protein [Luteimonas gilva]|uniref:YciI family protein n=1 Tax=Luteimonas gilva TaxID=2572684 RepID=A0A4U5JP98_9GAMM|nr:YciI family protein [Luteimonas gilva]TKR30381.1 YciI family protein [Luteimonas gilva]